MRSDELLRLVQAFCHPQSPRRDDPALIAPILRRLAFFAEYTAAGGPVLGDFGPCGNLADACLILTTCRPEIIPPGLRRDLDQGIRNNADAILAKSSAWAAPLPTSECLVNADVNYVLAVTTYPAGTKHVYLVEVRPATSPAATVRKVDAGSGLLAFLVSEGKTTYQVAFNPGETPLPVAIRPPGTLHRSDEAYRPEWLKAAGDVPSVAPIPCST